MKDDLDNALDIDVEKVIKDAEEQTINSEDDAFVEKYNERKKVIDELQKDLKDARTLSNRDWSEALLKRSAEKAVVTQEIFSQEIEDDPCSKNVTAFSELGNMLVNTVGAVQDIDREQRKLEIQQEKNDLRRKEIEMNSGEILDTSSKSIVGVGTTKDMLKLIKSDIDPIDVKQEGDDDVKE